MTGHDMGVPARRLGLGLAALTLAMAAAATTRVASQSPIGYFEGQGDVGQPAIAGSAKYDSKTQRYTLTGAGTNMWAAARRVPASSGSA